MQVRKLIFAVTATLAASLAPTLMIAAGASATAKTERFSFADTSTSAGPPVWSVIATGDFIAGGDVLVANLREPVAAVGAFQLHVAASSAAAMSGWAGCNGSE